MTWTDFLVSHIRLRTNLKGPTIRAATSITMSNFMFAFASKYNGFTSHQIRCLYTAKHQPLLQGTGKEEAKKNSEPLKQTPNPASYEKSSKSEMRASDGKSPEKKKDFEYIRSQIDKANNPGPKRLHTLKDSLEEEWEALKETFDGAKKDASQVDHPKVREEIQNLEERHVSITEKVKNWVRRGREHRMGNKANSK